MPCWLLQSYCALPSCTHVLSFYVTCSFYCWLCRGQGACALCYQYNIRTLLEKTVTFALRFIIGYRKKMNFQHEDFQSSSLYPLSKAPTLSLLVSLLYRWSFEAGHGPAANLLRLTDCTLTIIWHTLQQLQTHTHYKHCVWCKPVLCLTFQLAVLLCSGLNYNSLHLSLLQFSQLFVVQLFSYCA